MTAKDFIRKFELTKTSTKAYFADGRANKVRTLYINPRGDLYVLYDNDLCLFEPYKHYEYVEGVAEIQGRLCGAYSWYH